jgi:sulfur carrier protein ThiS
MELAEIKAALKDLSAQDRRNAALYILELEKEHVQKNYWATNIGRSGERVESSSGRTREAETVCDEKLTCLQGENYHCERRSHIHASLLTSHRRKSS